MSAMSELDLRLRDGYSEQIVGGLTEIARALGGEIDGHRVLCPSPGRSADDRSMILLINPRRPDAFFVYDCEGPFARAREMVREKLSLAPPIVVPSAENSAYARRIWSEAVAAPGTAIETYLRARAINVPTPGTLRFHPALRHGPTRSTHPAMVALVTDQYDAPVAVHRTYLRSNGTGKAPIEPNKMALGPITGCAVRLAPLADGLLIGEGIETCLSAMQATGRPAWSALSAVGLRQLILPASVSAVTILADGDDAGEAASRAAAARWLQEGRRVRIARAPLGKDFNDVLIAETSSWRK